MVLAGHHLLSSWSYVLTSMYTPEFPVVKPVILRKSLESGPILSIAPGEQLNIRVYMLDDLLTQRSEKLTATVSIMSFVII